MRCVIVGARKRSEAADEDIVNKLIDQLLDKYPQLKVISGSCDRGIGKIVKGRCLPESLGPKPKSQFPFIEVHIRPYLQVEMTSAEFAELFIARNAMFAEYGEEFHLFVDEEGPRGMMSDLYNRIKARGAPASIYKPGEREPKDAVPLK